MSDLESVRAQIADVGCRVEWIGRDEHALVWAVVYSPDTGKRYKWPGMFAWRGPLPGEAPAAAKPVPAKPAASKPADRSTDPPKRQKALF